MVSQADHHHHHQPSTLTVRGASSVVHAPTSSSSRSHLSRAKRYNRSHAGGTSYIPQNEFPVFSHSGDVEILVCTAKREHTNRYLLHKHTLTRCSGLFEASTSNEWSRARTIASGDEVARTGQGRRSSEDNSMALVPPRKRWRFELDWGDDDGDIPMLVQKDEDQASNAVAVNANSQSIFGGPPSASSSSNSRTNDTSSSSRRQSSSASNHSFFRSVANLSLPGHSSLSRSSRNYNHGHHHSKSLTQEDPVVPPHLSQADADLLRDYDNMFRIFYNYPPVLDSVSIADAYVQCKSLLTLADQYDALPVVGPRVDHHLLQFQSRLWKQVAKYPISYLKLGFLARSRIIFQEALIHVVGQWPAGERSIRSALPETVVELIEFKVEDLEEAVSRAETRLFRLGLTTSRGDRVTPQNGYLDWLALSLFRQWLAENTAPFVAPPPPVAASAVGGAVMMPGNSTSGGGRHGQGRHGGGNTRQQQQQQLTTTNGNGNQKSVMTTLPPITALGRAFRVLGAPSNSSYLTHDECKRFLKLTPELYSRDNLRRFEKRVDELKGLAREVVRPLMGSGLELDASGAGGGTGGLGYLTCTIVEERDLPWAEGE
ncbi:hypothetical protein MKZ38_007649 [Zalerion maritima]|uniref:Uncharacterized protein n=1 Tax=Zalerion maritima TaxID=339359 RepID=A0AAD5S6E8_9PEZI|nr:hypothetical protein MKZ38_007649 [Zalerion maritima]